MNDIKRYLIFKAFVIIHYNESRLNIYDLLLFGNIYLTEDWLIKENYDKH